jgi:DNA (cytosine-5)-methyltransferase 1
MHVREQAANYNSNDEIVFKYGELFSGPGGLALGAKNATLINDSTVYRIQHAWASDYSYDACETYRRNICPDQPETVKCIDVRELDIKSLPKIDAFAFGFPCNDFSLVGQQ